MLNITRKDYTLTVEGHAGFAQPGQDIVCAAASMLFYTLHGTLTKYKYELAREDYEESGIIAAIPNAGFWLDLDVIFDTICTGYKLLAAQHPEHVAYTDAS